MARITQEGTALHSFFELHRFKADIEQVG
jgi:hypothetical protein